MSDLGEITFEDLTPDHNVAAFACTKPDFARFLQEDALSGDLKGLGHTVVAVRTADRAVLGYHTLCTGNMVRKDLPPTEANLPRFRAYPGVLLAKLAVHQACPQCGLGKRLLLNAMRDALKAGQLVGWRFLLIDAYDDDALAYYHHLDIDFLPVPNNPKRIYMSIETVRAALGVTEILRQADA